MLSAIREISEKPAGDSHAATAEYLEACNKIFERGILSHKKITHLQSPPLMNMHAGFSYFQHWHHHLQETCPGVFG